MAPITIFSKGGRDRPTGGRDSIMGNYRIPKKNSTAEEERKRQRLRDTRNLATGIEIALKNLLPNESRVVKKAVWNTHDSLAVDIELGVDSSRTDFLGARVTDRATPTGPARKSTGAYYGRLNNGGGSFEGVPSAPRAMTRHWSVLDQGKIPDHPYQQGPRDPNGSTGGPRPAPHAIATDSTNGEHPSDPSGRTSHPYLPDPSDPNRLIGVPRPRLPAWATRPNYGKPDSEKPVRTSHPYLQDPSDPDKFVGVPRPFDWKDQSTVSDKYTGAAFHEHRRRQIELGIFPSIYPDHWISGETFGDDDKDISSAKRLYEKEQGGIRGSGVALSDGVDRDGDVDMTQVLEIPKSIPPSVSPAPVSSACGSLIQVFDGFCIEDEVFLETAETLKASQDFFAGIESEETPEGNTTPPAASEGRSGNDEISSLVNLADSKASGTASTSMFSRIGATSGTDPLVAACIQKMQPYRTSSVVGSSYAPTVLSGAPGLYKSHLGAGSQRRGGYGTSNYSAASKAPSTVFSYAGSSVSRNCPFDTMFDSVLENAIDIPVLEPTPASKSSLFAGHASNLRVPMSHNEKVSQWAASIMPNASPNGQLASPNKSSSASRAPVEFIFPRIGKNALPTRKLNNLLSNDLFEIAGGGNPNTHASRATKSSKGQ